MQIVNQLTAIPDDGFISVNGEALFFSYNSPLGEVKAAQWAVKQGQLEYYDVELNRAFGIEGYQDCVAPYVALWRAEKERLEVEAGRAPTPGQLAERVRARRDGLLGGTDYLMLPDYQLTEEERAALVVYRQALRDMPTQPGFPAAVVWPPAPASLF